MNIIIRQTVTGTLTVENFPTGREVIVQTDADLQLEFWNPTAGEFAAPLSVSAPQAVVVCPSAKVRITTTTTANVNVALSNAVNADAVKTVAQTLTGVQQSHARENLDLWAYIYPLICGVAPSSVEYSDGNIVRFIVRRADGTRIRIDFVYLAGDYAGSITASDTRLLGDPFEAGASLEWSVDSWYLTTSEGVVSALGEYLDNPANLVWPAAVESVVSQIADTGMIALFPNNPDAALWFNPALSVWTRVSPDGEDLVRLSGSQTIGGAKTFSGQMELTGQAATNPTSAMTRELGDLRYPRVLYSSAVKVSRPASVSTHTLASVEIPANALGPNGWLEIRLLLTGLNTATVGTRYNNITFGGAILKQHSPTAGVNYNISQDLIVHNRGLANSQITASRNDRPDFIWGSFTGVGVGGDAGSMVLSVDTTLSQNLVISHQSVDAADTAFLQFLQVIAQYAP